MFLSFILAPQIMQITFNTHEKRLFGKCIDRVTRLPHSLSLSFSLSTSYLSHPPQ